MSNESRDILDFTPQPLPRLATAYQRFWNSPQFYGWENIDRENPSLFVSNHTIYGVLDGPLMGEEVYAQTGIVLRGLADRMHSKMPYWQFLVSQGAVVGSPENCKRLMEDGQSILVYPGGGREVCKRKGEAYKLIWKKRTGFARMAIQHGYSITPVAAVGAEECYTIHIDANDVMNTPIGKFLKETELFKKVLRNGDMIPPFATGHGLTFIPRSERFYFSFGKPISTKEFSGKKDDEEVLWRVREEVEKALYSQIKTLQEIQSKDPNRRLIPSFF